MYHTSNKSKTENNTQIGTIPKSNIKIVDCSFSCLSMGTKPAFVKWCAMQVLSMCELNATPNKQHGEHQYYKDLSRTLDIIYLTFVTQRLSYA